MYHENRVEKLCSILSEYDVYGYFMGAAFDLKFLTGIDPFPDERFKGMLVLKDHRKLFISPELYYEDFRITLGEDMPIYVWSDGEGRRRRPSRRSEGNSDWRVKESPLMTAYEEWTSLT